MDDQRSDEVPLQRVAIVTNIVAPYRLATWDAIARRTGNTRLLLCAASEANRIWDTGDIHRYAFEAEILPGRSIYLGRRSATLHWNPSILRRLKQLRPTHLIIGGWDSPTHIAALLWARAHGIPCAVWTGSHSASHTSRGALARWLRRVVLALPKSFLVYGNAARMSLEAAGVDPATISVGFNCIDVEGFARYVDETPPETPPRDRIRFLYVGQLIARKGVRQLLHAFAPLDDRAELRIVGYGEEAEDLRELARTLGLHNVHFAGATRTVEETARHYAGSDILVMPSLSEVWGLVVNEGLAAGLFVVASRGSGAAQDLIEGAPLQCGLSYDAADPQALTAALAQALEQLPDTDRNSIAAWGRSITPERYAQAAVDALRLAEGHSARSASAALRSAGVDQDQRG